MDSNRWQKIEELYNSALSQVISERQGWLSKVCPDDETLRLEVLSLLRAAETSDSFLEEPALRLGLAVIESESESLVGHTVGPYKILEGLKDGQKVKRDGDATTKPATTQAAATQRVADASPTTKPATAPTLSTPR